MTKAAKTTCPDLSFNHEFTLAKLIQPQTRHSRVNVLFYLFMNNPAYHASLLFSVYSHGGQRGILADLRVWARVLPQPGNLALHGGLLRQIPDRETRAPGIQGSPSYRARDFRNFYQG